MKILIPEKQVSIIQKLIGILIPGMDKLEINQPTAIQTILKRLGESGANTATKAAQVFQDYAIHIEAINGIVSASLRGISLESCPVTAFLGWKDPGAEDCHVAVDPHGFSTTTAQAITFNWNVEDSNKIVVYTTREVNNESDRIRRLSDSQATISLKNLRSLMKESKSLCTLDLSDQKDFISHLCSLAVAGMGEQGQECIVNKSKHGLLALWILKEHPAVKPESYGFLVKKIGPVTEEENLICTRALLRSTKAILAGVNNQKLNLKTISLNKEGEACTLLFSDQTVQLRISIQRDHLTEYTDIKNYLKTVRSQIGKLDLTQKGGKQDLTRVMSCLSQAGAWASARQKITTFSAINISLKPDNTKSEVTTLVQEPERSCIFRMGDKTIGVTESLVFSSEMLTVIQGQIRGWMQQENLSQDYIRLLEANSSRALIIGSGDMRCGFLIRKNQEAEKIGHEVLIYPESKSSMFEVEAEELSEAILTTINLANLPGVMPAGSKAFGQLDTDLALMTIKGKRLSIEAGSDASQAGMLATVPIIKIENFQDEKDDDRFYTFGISSRQFLALSKILSQMIRQQTDKKDITVSIRLMAENIPGHLVPTFEFKKEGQRIMVCGFRQCMVKTHNLPNKDMGSWQVKSNKKNAEVLDIKPSLLPIIKTVADNFCLTRDDIKHSSNPQVAILQNVWYESGPKPRIMASNMYQAIEVHLPEEIFGDASNLVSQGYIQTASLISEQRKDISFTKISRRSSLGSESEEMLKAQWYDQPFEFDKFPSQRMGQILHTSYVIPDTIPKAEIAEIGIAKGTIVPETSAATWEAMMKRISGPAIIYEHSIFVITEKEILLVPRSLLQNSTDMDGLIKIVTSSFNKGIKIERLTLPEEYKGQPFISGYPATNLIKMTRCARDLCKANLDGRSNSLTASWTMTPLGFTIEQDKSWKMLLRPIVLEEEEKDLVTKFVLALEEKE